MTTDHPKNRGQRSPWPWVAAVALVAGCQLTLETDAGPECRDDRDCLAGEFCDPALRGGRCVAQMLSLDLGPPPLDAARRDAATPDVDVADVPIDASADAIPYAVPDAVVDALVPPNADGSPPPYGRDGRCFEESDGVLFTQAPGVRLVPRVLCTPHTLVWTADDGHATRIVHRAYGTDSDGPIVRRGAPLTARGPVVLVQTPRDTVPPIDNILRIDLRPDGEATTAFIDPSLRRQIQPARGDGVSAYIEENPRPDGFVEQRLILFGDDGRRQDCGRPDRRQWGVALAGDSAAWFEQPLGSGRIDLAISFGLDCDNPIVLPVPGLVSADVRLHASGQRLVWLRADPQSRRREVWTITLDRLASGPVPIAREGETADMAEIALHGDWLAVSRYAPGGYTLELLDLTDGSLVPWPHAGSARQPSLSGAFLMWAEQETTGPWEIHYARLPER